MKASEIVNTAFLNILHAANVSYNDDSVTITGHDPVVPTKYLVGTAGAASLAAVGYAASSLWSLKTCVKQQVNIDVYQAALAQLSHQYVKLLGGKNEALWDPLSGFYATRDNRHIQLHCNFPEHRQGVLDFLGCTAAKSAVSATILQNYNALELEAALNELGLCASMVRTHDEWNCSEQGIAIAKLPLFEIIKKDNGSPRIVHYESTNKKYSNFYNNSREAKMCHIVRLGAEYAKLSKDFTLVWNLLIPDNEESEFMNEKRIELDHCNGVAIFKNMSSELLFCATFTGPKDDINFAVNLLRNKRLLLKDAFIAKCK